MRWAIRWALGVALLASSLAGCNSGGGEFIAKGRKALRANNYDAAHQAFDDALKQDPESYDGLWGKAEAYRGQAKLPDQQKLLERIMTVPKLAEAYAGVVKPALEENYRKQAETILGTSPDKAEALLRKAIEINKRSEANTTLSELLTRDGNNLLKQAKYKEASARYAAAIELRIARKARGELQGKKEIADFWARKADFMPRFEVVKNELIEAKIYDDKAKAFFVTAEAEIEGDPKDDENFEANAELDGLVAVTVALNELTWKVAGKERPENASVAYDRAVVSVVSKNLEKRKKDHLFTYRVAVPADALFEKVFEVDEGKFEVKAPEAAAADGGAPAPEEKPAEEKAPE